MTISSSTSSRITGLASSMDTESLVKNALAVEQAKIDKLFRSQEKDTWKTALYTNLRSGVSTLRNDYLTYLGGKSITKSSTYNAYAVNMVSNSALKISATSSATANAFNVQSVQMATAASLKATAGSRAVGYNSAGNAFLQASVSSFRALQTDGGSEIDLDTTTIGELKDQFGLEDGDELSFSINGDTFTFSQNEFVGNILAKVNGSATANVNAEFENGQFSFTSRKLGAGSQIVFSDITGKSAGLGVTNELVEKKSIISANTTTIANLEAEGINFKDANGSYTASINGKLITFDGNTTIQGLMDQVNSSGAGVKMTYSETTGRFRIENDDPANPNSTKSINAKDTLFSEGLFNIGNKLSSVSANTPMDSVKRSDTIAEAFQKMGKDGTVTGKLTMYVNEVKFEFDAETTTINDMMNKINNDTNAQASFSYSELTDSFTFTSNSTGSGAALKIEGFDKFGFVSGVNDEAKGTDAELKLGDGTVIKQSTNTFTLDGLHFEITGDYAATNDPINVSVTRDYQSTIDEVKGFIEEYNKTVEKLNSYYYEKVETSDKNYKPLTKEERAAITEKEAEEWDAKAKKGLLKNDPAIGSLLTKLRSSLMAKVESTGLSAADLGITTVAWNKESWRTDQGKLQLDEEKFRSMLEENPNAVQETLAGTVLGADGKVDASIDTSQGVSVAKSGLFTRISTYMNDFDSYLRTVTTTDAVKKASDYTDRMYELERKYAIKEERLWNKYTAMEKALSTMQSQMDWISQQFSAS